MILILIEMGGFDIVDKLNKKYAVQIVNDIKKCLFDKRYARSVQDGNYILFIYSDIEKVRVRLRSALDNLEKLFEHESEYLQGNLVFIDSAPAGDVQTHFKRLKTNLICLPLDKGIFFSDEFEKEFSEVSNPVSTDARKSEKNLYGMTISEKRELLQDIIKFSSMVAGNILSDEEIGAVLEKRIFSQPVFSNIHWSDDLYQQSLEISRFAVIKEAVDSIGYQSIAVRACFTDYLYHSLLDKLPSNIDEYYKFFISYGSGEFRLPAIILVCKYASLNYDLSLSHDIEALFLSSENSGEDVESLVVVKLIIRFYQSIICSDYECLHSIYDELLQTSVCDSEYLELERTIVLSDLLLTLRRHSDALTYIKDVMYRLNNHPSSGWFTCNANYLIAHAMLNKGKVSEADIYFRFAFESAERCGCYPIQILALVYRAQIAFLDGSLDSAFMRLESINQILSKSHYSYLFVIYYLFLKGRFLFEAGKYKQAQKNFDSLIDIAIKSGHNAGVEIFKAWKARSLIFSGSKMKGLYLLAELRPVPEKLVYEAEGRFLIKDYSAAFELLNQLDEDYDPSSRYLSSYINLFRNGYVNLESRVLSYDGQSSFQFYIQGLLMLSSAALGDGSRIPIWKKRLRNELKKSGDPSSRLYCFFLADACRRIDSDGFELDQLTMINRSLKYLQEYSGMTRDPAIRMGYLKNNYWNKAILQMASEFKLISIEKNSVSY